MIPFADNAPELLCAEVLAEAERQSVAMLDAAQAEAEALCEAAMAETHGSRDQQLHRAQAEATARRDAILATVASEVRRLEATRIEEVLESIREQVRQKILARAYPVREVLQTLSIAAARGMTGRVLIMKVAAADLQQVDAQVREAMVQQTGRQPSDFTLMADDAVAEGGVLLEDAEGRQRWDNRLLARLERLWPELRRQLAVQTGLLHEDPAVGVQT